MVDLTGLLPPADSLHGLAIGAVGSMKLAIMSRATAFVFRLAPALVQARIDGRPGSGPAVGKQSLGGAESSVQIRAHANAWSAG